MRRRGFTLVELLVVIGVIAVLMALLLPALNRARRQGRSVACLAHLQQLGAAFQIYLQHNNGKPPGGALDDDNVWVPLLRHYVPGSLGAMFCPEAPEPSGTAQYDFGTWQIGTAHHAWAWMRTRLATGADWSLDGGSYGINGWMLRVPPWYPLPRPHDWFLRWPPKESSKVPLLADGAYYVAWPEHTDPPPRNLVTPVPVRGAVPGGEGNTGMRNFSMASHGRAVNVLFVDGHARTVQLPDLWRLTWQEQFVAADVTLPLE